MRLLVTSPFAGHQPGDHIDDPAAQAAILASGRAAYVLPVAGDAPAPAAAPKPPASAPDPAPDAKPDA